MFDNFTYLSWLAAKIGNTLYKTPAQRFLSNQKELCQAGYDILAAKNHDYGATSDPFANFRKYGEQGILTRLSDKFSRIETLISKEAQVKSESLRDTIIDAINYLCILYAYVTWGKFMEVVSDKKFAWSKWVDPARVKRVVPGIGLTLDAGDVAEMEGHIFKMPYDATVRGCYFENGVATPSTPRPNHRVEIHSVDKHPEGGWFVVYKNGDAKFLATSDELSNYECRWFADNLEKMI